jgi:hypothetical protein
VTNSLQIGQSKKLSKKSQLFSPLILTPEKPTFLWKNLKTKKKLISGKTWQKILYKIGLSKIILREAEILTPTPLS